MDSKGYHNLALDHQELNDLKAAIRFYKLALKEDPTQSVSAINLANIYEQNGKHKAAVKVLDDALSASGLLPSLLAARANSFKLQARLSEAENDLQKSCRLFPQDQISKINLALIFLEKNNIYDANNLIEQVVNSKNLASIAAAYLSHTFNNTSAHCKQMQEALLTLYQKVAQDEFRAFIKRSLFRGKNGTCYYYRLHRNISFFLNDADSLWLMEEGAKESGECLGLIKLVLASRFEKVGNLNAAQSLIKESLTLNPDLEMAKVHLSDIYFYKGNVNKALEVLEGIPKLKTFSHLHMRKLLEKRDFKSAWNLYDKWQEGINKPELLNIYSNESINSLSKNILIARDQGIGDEIMFLSCLQNFSAKYKDSNITLACSPRLNKLVSRNFPAIEILDGSAESSIWHDKSLVLNFDAQLRLSKLPSHTISSCDDFSNHSFFTADNDIQREYRYKLNSLSNNPKVGFAWKGGSEFLYQSIKSIELSKFLPLLRLPNIDWVNLQYGDVKNDLAWFARNAVTIINYDDIDPLTDLERQAALISELDFVVQISNTSIHLAGALGTKGICLLPQNHDYRWFTCEKSKHGHSSWYPSIKLHIKSEDESWDSTISRLINLLAKEFNL